MRRPRMRNPCSSRWARILPLNPRATASGLMMASARCMASASEEFSNDVSPGQEPGEFPLADDGELLDILVDHSVGDLIDAQVLGDAEDGAGHDVADFELLGDGDLTLLGVGPGLRDVGQERAHDVPLGDDAEAFALLADDRDGTDTAPDHEVDRDPDRRVRRDGVDAVRHDVAHGQPRLDPELPE